MITQNPPMKKLIFSSSFLLFISSFSFAHLRYFTFTYDWFTPVKGEREIELWWTQREGGAITSLIEFEYGITDKYVIAPYLILEREEGEMEMIGWKVEQRYAFGEFEFNRILPALYFEVEREEDEYKLEAKAIGSFVPSEGNFVFSANLIVEKELEGDSKIEWGYAMGIAREFASGLSLGIESFGNWENNRHYYGPVAAWKIRAGTKLLATGGLPSNGGPALFRVLFEYEF